MIITTDPWLDTTAIPKELILNSKIFTKVSAKYVNKPRVDASIYIVIHTALEKGLLDDIYPV